MKSKTNPKSKFSKSKTSFGHLNLSHLKLFRISKFDIRIFTVIYILSSTILTIGCEAFVRKFTRKPKKENLPKEEMVLVPEEYKGSKMSKEDLYRKYFLFWKSWQDELINYLAKGANHKKQVDCAEQAIKNLINLRTLLSIDKQKKLDDYLTQLNELKGLITQDLYGNNITTHRQKAERIKRNILKDFSYQHIKNYLI